jgi:hypothetical protein
MMLMDNEGNESYLGHEYHDLYMHLVPNDSPWKNLLRMPTSRLTLLEHWDW